jgi:probable F420-dependent oxidoreductase
MATSDFRVGVVLAGDDHVPTAARRVEELGFDVVAAGEHLIHRQPTHNALVALAAAAAVTTRVRLISSVVLAPFYPPFLLAKQAAEVDVISGGRFELGLGVGGDNPVEFEAVGVPRSERGRRTDEALSILRLLFTRERSDYHGSGATFANVALDPRSPQPGGPPIWVGGRSPSAIGRAARFGGWLPYLMSVSGFARGVAAYRAAADADPNRPERPRCGVMLRLTVDPDGGRARAIAAEDAAGNYGASFRDRVEELSVAGSPDECIERLRGYKEAGAELLLLLIVAPKNVRASMLQRLSSEILPSIRR